MTHDATARHIPDRWLPAVKKHIRETSGEDRDLLSAYDFSSRRSVRVFFADNSFAIFHYAFCLHDEEAQEVAIFTEHCGYYFFSTVADMVSVQELEEVLSRQENEQTGS